MINWMMKLPVLVSTVILVESALHHEFVILFQVTKITQKGLFFLFQVINDFNEWTYRLRVSIIIIVKRKSW